MGQLTGFRDRLCRATSKVCRVKRGCGQEQIPQNPMERGRHRRLCWLSVERNIAGSKLLVHLSVGLDAAVVVQAQLIQA